MARRPRNETEPGVWHVWARGNNRQMIFVDDEDRLAYVRLLKETVQAFKWHCLAYCLMGNHIHLIVETTRPNLGDGMRWLHGRYAAGFNARNGRINHLFGERYGRGPLRSDEQVRQKLQYLALNPVAAGLCQHPQEWPWSSYREVTDAEAGGLVATDRVLTLFAGQDGNARANFLRYMDAPAKGPLVVIG